MAGANYGNSGNPGGAGGAQAPTGLGARPQRPPGGGNKNRVPGGEKRYWDPRLNKMATTQEIKNYKPPNATRQPAAARALGAPGHARTPAAKPAAAAKSPYLGEQIADPLGLLSRATKQKTAYGINEAEGAERQTALKPFQQKNAEIVNTQGNVSQRLGQLNQSNANYLGGLLGGAEGAKTANNYAAESALSAQRSVETAGQNAPTNVGGILASNLGATEQRGEANAQAMRMLAASAAARGQEEQGLATTRFATEAAKNRAAENNTLEKISNKAKNERLEYALKVYPDILAQNKLAAAERTNQQKFQLGAEKNQIGKQNANTNVFKANTAAQQGQEKINISAGKLNLDMALGGSRQQHERADEQYKNASIQDKAAVDSANIKFKEGELRAKWEANYAKTHPGQTGVKPTAAGTQKFFKEWGTALNALEASSSEASAKKQNFTNYGGWRQNLGKGVREAEVGGKPTKIKVETVTNPLILRAVEEAWTKHYVSPQTKAALNAAGLPSEGLSNLLKRG